MVRNHFFNFILIISCFFLSVGCSKTAKSPVKFQLKIGNFAGIPNGIGDGGSLLFGRSDDGKIFGKKLSSAGELLDLPNGNWTFYALFWDTSSTPMNGTVYCAIGALPLRGPTPPPA